MNNKKTSLVLGGTGHYGQMIVKSLLAKETPVRVLTRNIEKARKILGGKAELVYGDITNVMSVKNALNDIDTVVIAVSAFTPNQIRHLKEIEQDAVISAMQAAKKQGISRIVYISVFEADLNFTDRYKLVAVNEKAAVEQWLKNSDMNWTILGAPPSMEIFFSMIRGNRMMVPGGGPPSLPTISPVDVGEIAAQCALRNDLSGRRFKMVGPEAISFPEAAQRISRIWGRKIQYKKIPLFLPMFVRKLAAPLSLVSDKMLYVRHLLGYVNLLNNFPSLIAEMVPEMHQELLSVYKYAPITLEMEAERRK